MTPKTHLERRMVEQMRRMRRSWRGGRNHRGAARALMAAEF